MADINTLSTQFSLDRGTEPSTDFIIIGDQILDVAVSEEHNFEAEISSFPVESGSEIIDNIRILPLKISITGIVSNAPLPPVAAKRAGDPNPADSAYRYLSGLRTKRMIFPVTTSLDTFPNMVITSLSIPRAPGGADFLQFTCQMQEVLIVKTEKTIPVAPTARTATPPSNKHKPMLDSAPRPIQVLHYNNGSAWWWDDNIGGWRLAAEPSSNGIWWAYRGKPYGVPQADWVNNNQGDTHWKKLIQTATANTKAANASNQAGVVNVNQYDIFARTNMVRDGHVYSSKDVYVVSAKIVSADDYEDELADRTIFGPPSAPQAWYDPAVD